ncbi:MAG: hypothetical protein P8H03_00180, partial [Emcibacteraceae bacterium]|nr:hypothetical protein [Emcibacteraceae bacterium]
MTRADIIRKQAQTVAKLHEQGVYYFQNQQYNKARQCFQDACNIFPEEPQLLNALALALLNTAEFEEAKINYEKAIKFSKGRPSIELLDQYGFLLTHIGAKKEAIKIYEKIVGLNPNFLKGWVKLGDLYVFEHNELKAIECWKNVKRLEPESFIALRGLSNCYHALCDWDNADVVDKALKQITQKCISEDKLGPLAHHSAFLFEKSGSFMREVAENHNKELLESFESVGIKLEEKVRVKKYSRLRVGYLSSALSRHATAYLIQDLFKHHDTAKFEIFIFAGKLNLPCGSFDKIKETVEHFYDVCEMTDVDIARFIQDKDLDVLIDLDGIILDNKQAALTFKPAPIQITWLGMPATLGAPWIDYILSDNVISPPKYNSHYTETVLRMPDSYFFNSFSSLEIDETDKEALGLPEDKF